MKEKQISKAVIKRLPRYRRYLRELQKKGIEKISSKDLSNLIGYTASQIRQDLNNFGGFGQQGYGYSVNYLYEEIGNILGLNKEYQLVVVGYGRLGQAMASYIYKNEKNFHIRGIFDVKEIIRDVEFEDAEILTCRSLAGFVHLSRTFLSPADAVRPVTGYLAFFGVQEVDRLLANPPV